MFKIRKALLTDAFEIHQAHMRSINEVCAPSYTKEEIAAWGGREFNLEARERAILNDFVWVIELDDQIQGFAHAKIRNKESGEDSLYLNALYFDKSLMGKGAGHEMIQILFSLCKERSLKEIYLSSSLNALGFYEKYGFKKTGEITTETINGTPIRCFPMFLKLT